LTGKLSIAGSWQPLAGTAGLVGPFWNVIRLGADQREGVVLAGWAYQGSFGGSQPVVHTQAAALSQGADGRLSLASTSLLGDAGTNGVGSIVVADFNGDGFDDLFLAAHNESPFVPMSSVAWISGPGGALTRQAVGDSVMNHDARLVTLGGKKKILSSSFGGVGNVLYSWNGASFTVDLLGQLGGMSVQAGDFNGDGSDWLIIGDSFFGPGITFDAANPMLNYAYSFASGVVATPPKQLPTPYFNGKAAYAGFKSEWDPASKTHTSRLWATDLNQDGRIDLLAGQEIWSAPNGLQKAVFQLLVNQGGMAFADQTDALAPEFSQDSYIDYSVRLADIDGSGIDTIFLASNPAFSAAQDALKQGQYVLVNDGTGRLYAALHDEFRAMGDQVLDHVAANLTPSVPRGVTPQFIGYRTPNGKLNFLAVIGAGGSSAGPNYALVNVALQYSPATDFKRNLTISSRNGSHNIRTFAGDDTISRALADPDCRIDAGLGVNTVVYPGKRADWIVLRVGSVITIRPVSGTGGTDSLTRVQKAHFDDITLDLSTL
jgi:hypothetical protein